MKMWWIGPDHSVHGPPWRFFDWPPGGRGYLVTEVQKWTIPCPQQSNIKILLCK